MNHEVKRSLSQRPQLEKLRRYSLRLIALAAVAVTGACSSNNISLRASATNTSVIPSAVAVSSTAVTITSGLPTTSLPSSQPSATMTPGNIRETESTRAQPSRSKVAITATGSFGNNVSAQVMKRAAVTATAHLPGEISGPALEFTIRISNASGTAIDLNGVQVALTGKSGQQAIPISESTAPPFSGKLATGHQAIGTYLFKVPVPDRIFVTLSLSYTADEPLVLFEGNVQ